MTYFAVYGGILFSLGLTICFLTYSSDSILKIPIAIFLLFLTVVMIVNLIVSRKTLPTYAIFLDYASQMLGDDKCCAFTYIPLFIIFTGAYGVLWALLLQGFLSGGALEFDEETSIFYQFSHKNEFFLILLGLNGFWGLSFLKEAFNFCIAGNAVAWYYSADWSCQTPMSNLICKHFGSVVAGSFMTGFFSIGDYFFDLIKPSA